MTAPANILTQVHSTCLQVVEAHAAHITIDREALARLAATLSAEEVTACARGLQLPVKFDSVEAEVSFLALYHLLDFGSGYDRELKARCRRDAREQLQYAVLGMHMQAKRMDAAWMAAFTNSSVSTQFNIETHDDAPVPSLPGVTMSRPGVLAPLVGSYATAVAEAGAALQEEGAASLGQAIISVADGLHKRKHVAPAAAMVQELCDNLPAFADTGLYEGTRVVFARKAQGLVFELYLRYHQTDPRFNFPDLASFAADSGSTVPAVLRATGVLKYGDELAALVDAGTELPQGAHERAIRAAAVVAVDELVAALRAAGAVGGGTGAEGGEAAAPAPAPAPGVTAAHVGGYLEWLAEEGQALHGQIHKHYVRGTTAY